MEENKVIVQITNEGVILCNYLVMNYDELLQLIAKEECKIIFDSMGACVNLKSGIFPYIETTYCVQLAKEFEMFIAGEYDSQVTNNSI